MFRDYLMQQRVQPLNLFTKYKEGCTMTHGLKEEKTTFTALKISLTRHVSIDQVKTTEINSNNNS
jgi:hypothetical protein